MTSSPCPSCGWPIGHVIGCPASRDERAYVSRRDVWVQCGSTGARVPEAMGVQTALDMLDRRYGGIASIHDVSCCGLAKRSDSLAANGGRCSCEPTWVNPESRA